MLLLFAMLHHNASKFILKEQLVFWQQRDVVTNTHSLCCDQKLPLWLKCVKCSLCCRCWEIRVVWQTHTVFSRRSCYVVKVLCTMLVFDTLAWRYISMKVLHHSCVTAVVKYLVFFPAVSTSAVNQWMTDRTARCLCEQEGSVHKAAIFFQCRLRRLTTSWKNSENSHQHQTNCGRQQDVAAV